MSDGRREDGWKKIGSYRVGDGKQTRTGGLQQAAEGRVQRKTESRPARAKRRREDRRASDGGDEAQATAENEAVWLFGRGTCQEV